MIEELVKQIANLQKQVDGLIKPEIKPRILFSAYNSVTDTDVTGDGTNYSIICDTEIFDIGDNYNNITGIFTAPIDGKYLFIGSVLCQGILSTHTGGQAFINTSNRVYSSTVKHPYNSAYGGTDVSFLEVCLADMESGDTAYFSIQIVNGTKVVDVFGGTPRTYFQCALI